MKNILKLSNAYLSVGILILSSTEVVGEPLTLTVGFSLNQNDPAYLDLLRRWANDIEAATEGEVRIALTPVEPNETIDFANKSGLTGAFYTPIPTDSLGFEVRPSLPNTFPEYVGMTEQTERLWMHIKPEPAAVEWYGTAVPIGAAVYADEKLAEVRAFGFDTSDQLQALGIEQIASDQAGPNEDLKLVLGTDSMLRELQITAAVEGKNLQVLPYDGEQRFDLGSRVGILMLSEESWKALSEQQKSTVLSATKYSVLDSIDLIEWQTTKGKSSDAMLNHRPTLTFQTALDQALEVRQRTLNERLKQME